MIKIALDTLGGDNSPLVNIEGAVKAVNEIKDLHVFAFGDETVLKNAFAKYKYDAERITIVHAPEEITCNDKPTDAIRLKKESSLVKAIELVKTSEDVNALVSIGSTGAVLSGAVLKIGRIQGVKRPALCPVLPTMADTLVTICDSGANAECDAEMLYQFAIMANEYVKKAFGVEKPRVALLNIGAEEEKGDLLRKETYAKLKENANINFIGNIEGRELLSGVCDVVVCDGFSGNVLLKSTEGACIEVMKLLKKSFTSSLKAKLGALLLKKKVYSIKDKMDYNNYGGAVLLGCKKTVVKGHGSGNAVSVYNCIKQAYNMEKNNLRESIAENINL